METVAVGGNRKYLILCNNVPMAGFDVRAEAIAALEIYKRNPNEKDNKSKHNWELKERP
jgi:hypothetical protein